MNTFDIDAIRAFSRIENVIAFYSGRPLYETGSPHELKYHCVFPQHAPDEHPSASVNVKTQRCFCFGCRSGGDVFTLVRACRQGSLRDAASWLAEYRWSLPPTIIRPLARLHGCPTSSRAARGLWVFYRYRDANGIERYQILRTPDKQFLFRHLSADGDWIWNGDGVPRLLYKLHAIQELPFAFIPEGEKDCNTLWSHGLPAVTNPGGAGKWRDRYTRQLIAAGVGHVVILPDNDEPGREHARMVARSCRLLDVETRVVRLPDLPPKGDVTDWFAAGHTRRDLLRLLRRRPA